MRDSTLPKVEGYILTSSLREGATQKMGLKVPLTKKNKIYALMAGVLLPYLAFVFYFALRVPQHPLPYWLPYFCAFYLLGGFVVVMFGSQRFQGSAPPQLTEKARRWRKVARGIVIYLIAVWSIGFLYGAYQAFRGDYPLARSLAAEGFLLAFIALFSWALYRDYKKG